jgi:DNA-binding NarL/FixJ family response regulator
MSASGCVIRVVVADDSPEVRLLVRVVLEDDDEFVVEAEAEDGREAIDLAARLHPDLMLLDLSMPIMNGHEALPKILEASPETQVVVLSAFPPERVARRLLEAGAQAFLDKTSDLETLPDQLRGVIQLD